MKRKSLIFFLLLALFAPLAMNAQSTHSWGSSSTNSGTNNNANPFGRFYGFEYRVYLYPPNTMDGVSGDITKLEFLPYESMSSTGGQIDVWMKSVTDITSLSSSTTFATYKSGATLVYSNSSSPSFTSGTYVSLPLSTPVAYNYSNNEYLMILVRSVANSTSGDGGKYFYYYNPGGASDNTWYAKKDGSDPGENTVSSSSWGTIGTGAYLPVIRVTYTASTNPSISLSPNSATVITGSTQTLTATVRNVSGTPNITYTSSNTNVATVSGSGTTATVTAVAPGTATITASMTVSGTTYTATSAITVEDPSYCTPGTGNYDNDGIYNVTFGMGPIVNNTVGGINYGDYSNLVGGMSAGATCQVDITYKTGYTYGTIIWVDWNQNYIFEGTEAVYAGQSGSDNPTTLNATFTVPATAQAGDYRMRIIGSDSGLDSYTGSLSAAANADPCGSYSYSTCHDYTLRVSSNPYIALDPSSATVLTGFNQTITATYGNVSGTPNITYTSSNTNVATVSGSGTTATVTAVAPGTATITATMNGSFTATCAITVEDPSYCTPNPTSVDGKGITTLTFGSGDYVVNNSNSNGLPANSPYYGDYTSMVGSSEAGETVTVTITYSTGSSTVYSYGTIIWVDWNKNYEFEDSEIVYTGTSAQGSNGTPQVLTATFTVPATQADDDYRMRIAGADSYFDSYIGGNTSANHSPCFTSTYAVCHDYTLRVVAASTEPSITLAPETATLRLGSTLALTATVRNVSNPTITYTSSDNSIATVSGSGTTATVTSVAEGTVTITATMTVSGTTYTATSTITIQDTPIRVSDGTYLSWEAFAAGPANGTTYSGKTVYLERDITTSVKVSGSTWTTGQAFRGTFDGQGHTITLDMNSTETQASLFNYTYGATIKNLKVDGTITSTGSRAAGFVAMAQGGITFENCISDVTISSTSVQNGGFVGDVINGATFRGCAFTGKLLGESSNDNGGFVGHYHYSGSNGGSRTYTNCVFAPSEVTMGTSGSYTFCRLPNTTDDFRTTITNCYYTQAFGTEQGKQAYSVTGVSPVTVERSGSASNTYGVSGIDAYSTGLNFTQNGTTTIYAGSGETIGLTLSGADSYLADHGTLAENGSIYTLTMEANNTIITYNITLTKTIAAVGNENWEDGKGGYYLVASPIAQDVDPATVGMLTADENNVFTYDFYRFDQNQELEWQNYREQNFDLVNGQGYLYASKNGTTLTFSGVPYSGTSKTVNLSKTSGVEFEGFNLVGNPFAGDAYITKPFYTMENSDTYTPNEAGARILAMQGLFVVADNDEEALIFSSEAPAGSQGAKLNMNVSKNRSVVDQAIISFNEGQQLPKLQFRNGSTKVYMPKDGKEYAIVSAESMGTMPVSFKAESNGSYTLSFTSEEVSFAYLHLIDNMTGIETDLLANPSYSFEARTTDYESRFKLVFATGNNTNDDNFAFYSNGSFVINNEGEATLQVIDMNGRILKSESINGCANVNVKAAAGVYMLRLVNGNDVKVQKVVVR